MKVTFFTQTLTDSSSKPTTKSSWEEIPNLYDQEQMDSLTIETKKDLNETISDSEEEDNLINEDVNPSSKLPKSKDRNQATERGRWTEKEHQRFLEGLLLYINDWKMIHKHIGTRSATQARSHAQKFFIKIRRSIKDPYDSVNTKATIYQLFQKQLNKKFDIPNIQTSFENITHLILAEENSNKKKQTMKIKIPLLNLSQQSFNDLISNKGNEKEDKPLFDLYNVRHVFDSNSQIQSSIIQKERIFNCEKVLRKQSIANSNECYNDINDYKLQSNNYNSISHLNSNELISTDNPKLINYSKPYNDSCWDLNYRLEQGIKGEYKCECECDPFKLEFERACNEMEVINEYDNEEILFPSLNLLN